ncbi:MAG: chemotaxis-specific protein-glutamate methyltransferase CheB [Deltaproteobacteria bacterium]|nr:chemotaxis-specific protein-glutamate methyltransferase CheB [Deltaproteobacteria bacterium]
MKTMRILVVDDSAFNRRTLAELLERIPDVEVVGRATDGDEALRLVHELSPDLVTLDLEMPRMDGFTFLRLLMARRPTPVIVVSGYSTKENVFRALELGAIDFVSKPTRTITTDLNSIASELAEKVAMVRQLAPAGLTPARRDWRSASGSFRTPDPRSLTTRRSPGRLLVVASSTGGPTALVELFRRFDSIGDVCIVVAQHMPARFTRTFAQRLDRLTALETREAEGDEVLASGQAFVCPGGHSIEVVRRGSKLMLALLPEPAEDRYLPSADRLFRSAAKAMGNRVLGLVLTGMGDDGAEGAKAIAEAGGRVVAESPETAVIYGMPAAAVRAGAVERSLALPALCEFAAEWASPGSTK